MCNTKLGAIFLIAIMSFVILSLSGCGGGNPTAAGTGSTTILMGGHTNIVLNLTGLVSSFTGTASTTMAPGSVDSASTTASFINPVDITTDGINLYIADMSNNKIRKIVIATGAVSTLAGTGAAGTIDGPGVTATFDTPAGITTDGTNLYVTDGNNNKIRKIVIATGTVSSFTGTANASMAAGAADGTNTAATFNAPYGITTDGTNLYVTDSNNNKIRKIVIATGVVSSMSGTANASMAAGAADGTNTAATFNAPCGITTDGTNLYVTDGNNNKIRKIVIATGTVSSLTGTANSTMAAGAADGTNTAATFNAPYGITTDGTNLYVADQLNHKIRKIVIATGTVSSFTGTANTTMATGAADGASASARFWIPVGITTDGTNLYVSENGNQKIRKIQ